MYRRNSAAMSLGKATCLAAMIVLAFLVGACGESSGPAEEAREAEDAEELASREVEREATIEFETVAAVIDEDWPVDLMIPVGWHVENNIWGGLEVRIRDHGEQGVLSAEPGDETSIFTKMAFDTGCDGICEPNDWESRLNGPDGWLTLHRDGTELLRDAAVPGGWAMVEEDGRDVEVTVLRWDGGAARFLKCEVDVDHDDLHLVDRFVDACAAATPRWF